MLVPLHAAWLATALLLAPSPAQQSAEEVLYSRLTEDVWQVWLRDLASGKDTQLSFSEGDKRYPGWTSAGEVFYHSITQQAFVIRQGADGNAEHVPLLENLWPVRDLAWSPDDKHIAFSRIRTDVIDAANLCISALDAPAVWLTQDPGIQYNPTWSPDGSRIAFVSGNGFATYEIETIGKDGKDRRRLTENSSHEFLPAWSPDGKSIAFTSDRGGNYEIWIMTADGTNPRQLTEHPALDTGPCWSPDGSRVAYTSARGGSVQVWASPALGGEPKALVETPGGARDPAWRVRPRSAVDAASASESSAAVELSEVAALPKTFRHGKTDEVELRFRTSQPGSVRIDLIDEQGVVRRRLNAQKLAAGAQSIGWDGKDDRGQLVPEGVYRYVIVARANQGPETIHDPSVEPWGEMLKPVDFTFDDTSGLMRWIQPRAGFARLRAAINGFPLLATLLDWTPVEGGEQFFDWNGLDASGQVQLGSLPSRWITLELISMPRNTIIVAGSPAAASLAAPTSAQPEYAPLVATGDQAHLAVKRPHHLSLAPRFSMEFPGASLDAEGRPVVRGNVPVRITLAPEDAPSMTNALFEVAFYVDLQFTFEDEESTTPMTWVWDTTGLAAGPHLLTVNVFSYDGRIGCLTRPVLVEAVQ